MQQPGESGSKRQPKNSFRKALYDEWLPLAILAGLDREQLERMTPADLVPYIKAKEISRRARLEEINLQCFLTGIYVTHAICCAFSKDSSYPREPFDLFGEQISAEEKSRRDAELFSAYVSEYNLQIKKEEK